jgi:RNA polymerase sigma-70 factor (ECF subfamily)
VSPRPSPSAPDLAGLFDQQSEYVWNTLRRLGIHESELEDLVHEVFLKVQRRLDDYDPQRPVKPWLFGFAYRVAADHRRLARHRVEVLGVVVEAEDPLPSMDRTMELEEERQLVEAALDCVDIGRRAVLIMHDVEDVPIPAVAHALEIPVNTAYSRLRLGRAELAAAVTRLRHRRGVS